MSKPKSINEVYYNHFTKQWPVVLQQLVFPAIQLALRHCVACFKSLVFGIAIEPIAAVAFASLSVAFGALMVAYTLFLVALAVAPPIIIGLGFFFLVQLFRH